MQVKEGTCTSGLPCRIRIITERIVPVPSKIVCLHRIKSHLLKSIGENVNLVIMAHSSSLKMAFANLTAVLNFNVQTQFPGR